MSTVCKGEFYEDKTCKVCLVLVIALLPLLTGCRKMPPSNNALSTTLGEHESGVSCLALFAGGDLLASAGSDGKQSTIKLWEMGTEREQMRLSGGAGSIVSVAFSPDGNALASGDNRGNVKIWNLRTKQLQCSLTAGSEWVKTLAFSPNGKLLACGGDAVVSLWDTQTYKLITKLEGHKKKVESLAFSPDGKTLVTEADDRTIRVWDLESKHAKASFLGIRGGHVAFAPDGKTFVAQKRSDTARQSETVTLWDAKTLKELLTLQGHEILIYSLAYSPDSKMLATGSAHPTKHMEEIKLWDLSTGQELVTVHGAPGSVVALTFSGDGKKLIVAGLDAMIRIWDVPKMLANR